MRYFVVGVNLHRCIEYPLALSRLNACSNMTVLDVGCGNGMFSMFLAHKNCIVYGIDISRKAIKLARSRTKRRLSYLSRKGRIHFQVQDAKQLPYRNNFFDRITCISTIEHIRQDAKVMPECSRVLKPGGKMVLTFPYSEVHQEISPAGRRYSDKTFFERLIKPSGLKVITVDYWGHKHYRFDEKIWDKIPLIAKRCLGWSTTFTSKLFLGIVDRQKAIGVCLGLRKPNI